MSTILIIDDQPLKRKFLTVMLNWAGHHVVEAADGADALQVVRMKRPQLIIADLIMPHMDGCEFARRLRTEPAIADTPIIFYSADDDPKSLAAARACGVHHVLRKPADPETILRTVNATLGNDPSTISPEWLEEFDRRFLADETGAVDPQATVFIVDDDASTRNKSASILKSASFHFATYAGAGEFLHDFDQNKPGCLLLDLRMPGMTGIELLERLRSQHLDMPAIVVTGHGNVPTAVRSMKLGVLDFLEKPVNPHILLATVYRALRADAAARKNCQETQAIRDRFTELTGRERELLPLLVAGKSNKQIAVELGISIKTVHHHRSSLMAKTRALNVADLVRMSMIAGL